MFDTSVEILGESSLVAILNKQAIGQMAETFSCLCEWSDGSTSTAYIKRFKKVDNLGILNEITGYLIAKGCNLPVASRAGLVKSSPEIFNDNSDDYLDWAFIVSEVSGTNPVTFFNVDMHKCKQLIDLVASWDKVSHTIAFDDWVANQDRNLGNIIVKGKNEIFLIDHSNMPVSLNWQVKDLNPNVQTKNKLSDILWAFNTTPLPIRQKICYEANQHSLIYNKVKDELNYWWSSLLDNDQLRLNALEKFIEQRANLGPSRISSNLNMLAV